MGGCGGVSIQVAISVGSKRRRWPHLMYGDALLVDEAADVADVDAELVGDIVDADEPTSCWRRRGGHGLLLPRVRAFIR